MKREMIAILTFGSLFAMSLSAEQTSAAATPAQPQAQAAPVTNEWAEIAQYPGIHRIKYDSNGVVKSFVVVGSSRVSRSLGAVKGQKIAIQRARLQAKAEIVKWIKEKVKSVEKHEAETIITLKGNDNDTQEQGKSVEYTKTQITSFAEGIVKGTTVIYIGTQSKGIDQELSVVLGWSAKNARAANDLRRIMNDERSTNATSSVTGAAGGKTKELNLVSPEASEY